MRRRTVAMAAAFGVSAGLHMLIAACLGSAVLWKAPVSLLPHKPAGPPRHAAVDVELVSLLPTPGRGERSEEVFEAGGRDVPSPKSKEIFPAGPAMRTAPKVPKVRRAAGRRAAAIVRPKPVPERSFLPPAAQPPDEAPAQTAQVPSPGVQESDISPLTLEGKGPTMPAAEGAALLGGMSAGGEGEPLGGGGRGDDGTSASVRGGGAPSGSSEKGASIDERALSAIAARLAAAAEGKCYPRQARRRGIEGTALIRFCIGKDGQAGGVDVVRTSGSPLLDGAASCVVAAAAPFGPQVHPRCVSVPVRFRLRR